MARKLVIPVESGTDGVRWDGVSPDGGGDLIMDSAASHQVKVNQGGTVGTLVDLTTAQTLTNKTLTAPVLTGSVVTSAPIAAGAALTLVAATHGGKTILLDTAAGSTITLHAASGSGVRYRFLVSTTPTSNQHRLTPDGTDVFHGVAWLTQDGGDTVVAFETAGDNQVNLNGTTTGGILGAMMEIVDMASGIWQISIHSAASGTEVTPFATV